VAPGHDQASRHGHPGKLESREDEKLAAQIEAVAQAAVLGLGDGLTLAAVQDSDILLAAQAIAAEALKFRIQLDELLAQKIVGLIGEALS